MFTRGRREGEYYSEYMDYLDRKDAWAMRIAFAGMLLIVMAAVGACVFH